MGETRDGVSSQARVAQVAHWRKALGTDIVAYAKALGADYPERGTKYEIIERMMKKTQWAAKYHLKDYREEKLADEALPDTEEGFEPTSTLVPTTAPATRLMYFDTPRPPIYDPALLKFRQTKQQVLSFHSKSIT
jgi:hypothetical protein